MIIGIVGFKGGVGKTTTALLLETRLKGKNIILNLDFYQPFRDNYKWVNVKTIPQDSDLKLSTLSSMFDNIIIDCGGFDDKRIYDYIDMIDVLVFPTRAGLGDIVMLQKTINDTLKFTKDKKRVVLAVIGFDKDEIDYCRSVINEKIAPGINLNGSKGHIAYLPNSPFVRKMERRGQSVQETVDFYKEENKDKPSKNLSPYRKPIQTIDKFIKSIVGDESLISEIKF